MNTSTCENIEKSKHKNTSRNEDKNTQTHQHVMKQKYIKASIRLHMDTTNCYERIIHQNIDKQQKQE